MGATAGIMLLTGGSAVNSALDQRAAGSAARQRGEYEAAVQEQNATLAEQQATDALSRGQIAESRQRGVTRQVTGANRAALAAQGLDTSSGSAADVIGQDQLFGDLDALTIRNNAAREAWGYNVDAANQRQSARLARLTGQNEQAAYNNQATSTLLTGAANTYGLYSTRTKKPNQGTDPARGR